MKKMKKYRCDRVAVLLDVRMLDVRMLDVRMLDVRMLDMRMTGLWMQGHGKLVRRNPSKTWC